MPMESFNMHWLGKSEERVKLLKSGQQTGQKKCEQQYWTAANRI
mgnify:CR=1 FL=1